MDVSLKYWEVLGKIKNEFPQVEFTTEVFDYGKGLGLSARFEGKKKAWYLSKMTPKQALTLIPEEIRNKIAS